MSLTRSRDGSHGAGRVLYLSCWPWLSVLCQPTAQRQHDILIRFISYNSLCPSQIVPKRHLGMWQVRDDSMCYILWPPRFTTSCEKKTSFGPSHEALFGFDQMIMLITHPDVLGLSELSLCTNPSTYKISPCNKDTSGLSLVRPSAHPCIRRGRRGTTHQWISQLLWGAVS